MQLPTTQKSWFIADRQSFESMKFDTETKLPDVGPNDVLVRMHAASLNYRDLLIAKNQYPFPMKDGPFVPGSDGAGEVVAIGENVSRFQVGDKVCSIFNPGAFGGELKKLGPTTGSGGADGTLREFAAFSEENLVPMPSTLTYEEAATLPCAALTAWNALYGLKRLIPGQTVLTQGTGGVSIFAAQFAIAAGATVIATTSSAEKAAELKKLGVHHVINYRDEPEWGVKAKSLSPGGAGIDHIIEVGGPNTTEQSLKAVKLGGVITVIGFIGGLDTKGPTMLDALSYNCTCRGILVGDRLQFEEMNNAIDVNNIKPVVDSKIFKFSELKDAYQYQWDQKHFGKVVVTI